MSRSLLVNYNDYIDRMEIERLKHQMRYFLFFCMSLPYADKGNRLKTNIKSSNMNWQLVENCWLLLIRRSFLIYLCQKQWSIYAIRDVKRRLMKIPRNNINRVAFALTLSNEIITFSQFSNHLISFSSWLVILLRRKILCTVSTRGKLFERWNQRINNLIERISL